MEIPFLNGFISPAIATAWHNISGDVREVGSARSKPATGVV